MHDIAFSLFEKTGGPYFKTYEQSYVSLFILITTGASCIVCERHPKLCFTANYPDVMMPCKCPCNNAGWLIVERSLQLVILGSAVFLDLLAHCTVFLDEPLACYCLHKLL